MPTKKIRVLLFLILALILCIAPVNAQCSMCRAVLESEEGQQTAKGINNGIIYLMAIPYILVALVGWRIFKIYKS
jgi:hypothetical protein